MTVYSRFKITLKRLAQLLRRRPSNLLCSIKLFLQLARMNRNSLIQPVPSKCNYPNRINFRILKHKAAPVKMLLLTQSKCCIRHKQNMPKKTSSFHSQEHTNLNPPSYISKIQHQRMIRRLSLSRAGLIFWTNTLSKSNPSKVRNIIIAELLKKRRIHHYSSV